MQLPGVESLRISALAPAASASRGSIFLTIMEASLAVGLALMLISLSLDIFAVFVTGTLLVIAIRYATSHHHPRTGAIVLVGNTPLAAILAASLEEKHPHHVQQIVRAEHMSAAMILVRQIPCAEVVVVDDNPTTPRPLVDSRGFTAPLTRGIAKLEQLLHRVPLEFAAEDIWLQDLGTIRPLSPGYALIKRTIDIAIAFGLAIILLPLLPLIALAIRLDSRGPILYSQTRIGHGGRTFRIYKFRTMGTDAEAQGAVWATKRDPRITRVGGFMRKTRLDELPQIWNLLNGDMALVGPRPERPEFTTTLAEQIPSYDLRHTVKPGLTGWAQVCYRYTSSIRDTRNKVEYDLYYVKNCTLWLDLKIMLKTIKVVLAMKGQ